MNQLANFLPALVATLLGVVSLVAAHSAKRQSETRKRQIRAAAAAAEPLLPMGNLAEEIRSYRGPTVLQEGGTITVAIPGNRGKRPETTPGR